MVCTVPAPAHAQGPQVRRCMAMTPDQNAAQVMGYGLRRIKAKEVDIDDRNVTIMPVMAGLRGPALTLYGRDVRMAVVHNQSSPQELWRHARWNVDPIDDCPPLTRWNFLSRLKRDTTWNLRLDMLSGFTDVDPKILYRMRAIPSITIARPKGFMLGFAMAYPLGHNTYALEGLQDTRKPVRRDMAKFSNGIALERAYISWHTTPITDVHMGVSAGWIEEMYGGAGAEVIWRPFGSPLWVGADGWEVWRRDPDTVMNVQWTDERDFTGHVRVGYDVPFSRTTFSVAAGRYLAGDYGATVSATHAQDSGVHWRADVTWSDRKENDGFVSDTHFDGMVRAVWPMGGKMLPTDSRVTVRQLGRDGGQMIERPQPIESFSEPLSTREIIRHWPRLLDKAQ